MNNLTILTTIEEKNGRKRLTKTFSPAADGSVHKSDYDRAYLYDAYLLDVQSIHDLHLALTWLETQPHSCVIRGVPIADRRSIRRALHDDPVRGPATIEPIKVGVSWLMLDFDKLPVEALGLDTESARLDYLVSLLPPEFHDASYHYQWSASAGLDGWKTLSCHLWFWLSEPWRCRDLYDRFATGDFKDCEVDPAPFTPNQPHYTANPIFDRVDDPVASRSGLKLRAYDFVVLSTWFRPVAPTASAISPREHYQRFGLSRFDDLLADIGPSYHRPILRAAAHYMTVVDPADRDRDYLTSRLVEAIDAGVPGRSRKADYTASSYLNRVIDGAARKFGGQS